MAKGRLMLHHSEVGQIDGASTLAPRSSPWQNIVCRENVESVNRLLADTITPRELFETTSKWQTSRFINCIRFSRQARRAAGQSRRQDA
jgi:hypothetical protein